MMDLAMRKHLTLENRLYDRLSPHYYWIEQEVPFYRYGKEYGRMDICAQTTKKTHYYEVKCSMSSGAVSKAHDQAKRFYDIYGENGEFILVTPRRVKRIRRQDL